MMVIHRRALQFEVVHFSVSPFGVSLVEACDPSIRKTWEEKSNVMAWSQVHRNLRKGQDVNTAPGFWGRINPHPDWTPREHAKPATFCDLSMNNFRVLWKWESPNRHLVSIGKQVVRVKQPLKISNKPR